MKRIEWKNNNNNSNRKFYPTMRASHYSTENGKESAKMRGEKKARTKWKHSSHFLEQVGRIARFGKKKIYLDKNNNHQPYRRCCHYCWVRLLLLRIVLFLVSHRTLNSLCTIMWKWVSVIDCLKTLERETIRDREKKRE